MQHFHHRFSSAESPLDEALTQKISSLFQLVISLSSTMWFQQARLHEIFSKLYCPTQGRNWMGTTRWQWVEWSEEEKLREEGGRDGERKKMDCTDRVTSLGSTATRQRSASRGFLQPTEIRQIDWFDRYDIFRWNSVLSLNGHRIFLPFCSLLAIIPR